MASTAPKVTQSIGFRRGFESCNRTAPIFYCQRELIRVSLDEFQKKKPSDKTYAKDKTEFLRKFRAHLKRTDLRNWDRVTKRFFTIGGKHAISDLRRYCAKLFREKPGIRPNILYYLSLLGFSKATAKTILKIVRETKRYDDITLFQFVRLVTEMEVPRTKAGLEFIDEFRDFLNPSESDFDFYCTCWFAAKYYRPHDLLNLLEQSRSKWVNEQFLARQVVSVLPRVFLFKSDTVRRIMDDQLTSGPRDAASVASNIQQLITAERLNKRLTAYLLPDRIQKPYPLPKFLSLLALLSSDKLRKADRERMDVRKHISDPWLLHWLEEYSLI